MKHCLCTVKELGSRLGSVPGLSLLLPHLVPCPITHAAKQGRSEEGSQQARLDGSHSTAHIEQKPIDCTQIFQPRDAPKMLSEDSKERSIYHLRRNGVQKTRLRTKKGIPSGKSKWHKPGTGCQNFCMSPQLSTTPRRGHLDLWIMVSPDKSADLGEAERVTEVACIQDEQW